MSLPEISIPAFPLPVDVPLMLHPVMVHFAVALPVVILLLELINLALKRRVVGASSFLLMLLLVLVLFGAYLTGSADAKHAAALLSPDAKELLHDHKQMGIYLVYGSVGLLVIKLLSVLIRNTPMRVLFLLFLILFIVGIFQTGKKGGALVYRYGVNVQAAGASAGAQLPGASVQTREQGAPAADTSAQPEPKNGVGESVPSAAAEENQSMKSEAETSAGEVREGATNRESSAPASEEGNTSEALPRPPVSE